MGDLWKRGLPQPADSAFVSLHHRQEWGQEKLFVLGRRKWLGRAGSGSRSGRGGGVGGGAGAGAGWERGGSEVGAGSERAGVGGMGGVGQGGRY